MVDLHPGPIVLFSDPTRAKAEQKALKSGAEGKVKNNIANPEGKGEEGVRRFSKSLHSTDQNQKGAAQIITYCAHDKVNLEGKGEEGARRSSKPLHSTDLNQKVVTQTIPYCMYYILAEVINKYKVILCSMYMLLSFTMYYAYHKNKAKIPSCSIR